MASSWERVVVIDTENGSGELYSNLGPYNVITLEAPFSPERYVEAIHAAEQAGMEVIIIDSVSHEWDGKGGCLEINDKLASAKFKGNTWAAWSETTPRHQKFIEAIVSSSAHVITTVRNKVETMQTDDKKVKKVGTKEIQREGFEYELTANFNIDRDGHYALASKDRTELFISRDPFLITEQVGEELRSWNDAGAEAPKPVVDVASEKAKVVHNLKRLSVPHATKEEIYSAIAALTEFDPSNDENLPGIVARLEGFKDPEGAAAVIADYVWNNTQTATAEDAETNHEIY